MRKFLLFLVFFGLLGYLSYTQREIITAKAQSYLGLNQKKSVILKKGSPEYKKVYQKYVKRRFNKDAGKFADEVDSLFTLKPSLVFLQALSDIYNIVKSKKREVKYEFNGAEWFLYIDGKEIGYISKYPDIDEFYKVAGEFTKKVLNSSSHKPKSLTYKRDFKKFYTIEESLVMLSELDKTWLKLRKTETILKGLKPLLDLSFRVPKSWYRVDDIFGKTLAFVVLSEELTKEKLDIEKAFLGRILGYTSTANKMGVKVKNPVFKEFFAQNLEKQRELFTREEVNLELQIALWAFNNPAKTMSNSDVEYEGNKLIKEYGEDAQFGVSQIADNTFSYYLSTERNPTFNSLSLIKSLNKIYKLEYKASDDLKRSLVNLVSHNKILSKLGRKGQTFIRRFGICQEYNVNGKMINGISKKLTGKFISSSILKQSYFPVVYEWWLKSLQHEIYQQGHYKKLDRIADDLDCVNEKYMSDFRSFVELYYYARNGKQKEIYSTDRFINDKNTLRLQKLYELVYHTNSDRGHTNLAIISKDLISLSDTGPRNLSTSVWVLAKLFPHAKKVIEMLSFLAHTDKAYYFWAYKDLLKYTGENVDLDLVTKDKTLGISSKIELLNLALARKKVEPQKASDITKSLLSAYPRKTNLIMLYGELLEKQGKLEEARKFLTDKSVILKASKDISYWNLLSYIAEIEQKLGKTKEALKTAQMATKGYTGISLVTIFDLYMENKDYVKAYDWALKLMERYPGIRNNMRAATALSYQEKYQEAAAVLNKYPKGFSLYTYGRSHFYQFNEDFGEERFFSYLDALYQTKKFKKDVYWLFLKFKEEKKYKLAKKILDKYGNHRVDLKFRLKLAGKKEKVELYSAEELKTIKADNQFIKQKFVDEEYELIGLVSPQDLDLKKNIHSAHAMLLVSNLILKTDKESEMMKYLDAYYEKTSYKKVPIQSKSYVAWGQYLLGKLKKEEITKLVESDPPNISMYAYFSGLEHEIENDFENAHKWYVAGNYFGWHNLDSHYFSNEKVKAWIKYDSEKFVKKGTPLREISSSETMK